MKVFLFDTQNRIIGTYQVPWLNPVVYIITKDYGRIELHRMKDFENNDGTITPVYQIKECLLTLLHTLDEILPKYEIIYTL